MFLQKNLKKIMSNHNTQNFSQHGVNIPSHNTHISDITLVALVVTMVVLLILAGVTITA